MQVLQVGVNYGLVKKPWSQIALTAESEDIEVALTSDELLVSSLKFSKLLCETSHCSSLLSREKRDIAITFLCLFAC